MDSRLCRNPGLGVLHLTRYESLEFMARCLAIVHLCAWFRLVDLTGRSPARNAFRIWLCQRVTVCPPVHLDG